MTSWLLIFGMIWSSAGDDGKSATEAKKAKPPVVQELAGDLAEGWLAVARANSEAQLYGGPDCTKSRDRMAKVERTLCEEANDRLADVRKTLRTADKALAKEKMSQAEWETEFPKLVFRKLRATLFAMDERMRWETMLAMVRLCESPEHSSAAVRDVCPAELENATLTILKNDDRAFLRHFALELLATGEFTTAKGTSTLERIRRNPAPDGERGCVTILGNLDGGQLEAIAKGYDGSLFGCEAELAGRALAQITR